MSEFFKQSTQVAEQYMNYLAKTQEQILENVRQIPTFNAQDFPQFNLPKSQIEFPTAREMAQSAFSFTEKLVAQQHSFVEQLLDISENKTKTATASPAAKQK